jgi:uncharacterized protein (TIGR03437 family)
MVKAYLFGAVCVSVAFGSGNTLVAPNGNANSAGNASGTFPTTSTSLEFQELIGGGQLPLNPVQITGISFRATPGAGPIKATIGSLSVSLSTSPNTPNTSGGNTNLMSSTFVNNVGTDKTAVYSGSNITWSDAGCSKPGPCPFDINIVFTTPFHYGGTGAILIDLSATNISQTSGAFDATSSPAPGGSVAQVVGTLGSATGTFAYQGDIVELTYTPLTTNNPTITGVVNVASNIPPGLPNYGIAQGALFAIYGSNLGPASLVVAPLPLPTNAGLAGTSITIEVNGTVVTAPIYFTRTDVVVAVMPSNTPVGNGTLILTFNGLRAAPSSPVTVVQSNFGISNLEITNANNGPGVEEIAAVTFDNYQSITNTNTAAAGDNLVLWGTGLGATPNNGGDTAGPPAGNIGSAPLVFVGGVQSPSVSYWGRAPGTIPGLDQINFVVPPNVPLGCNVGIVVQTTNGTTPIVSNGPTISLAATDGTPCSDPTQPFPSSSSSKLGEKVMLIGVEQSVSISPNSNGTTTTTTTSGAQADFFQLTQALPAALTQGANAEPSFGTCYTGITANPFVGGGGGLPGTLLNAGTSVTLTPPSGKALTLTAQTPGAYQSASSSTALPSGTWSFSNGAGGSDIGPLSFTFPVPQQVTWSNQTAVYSNPIVRTNPLTITWSGGDSNGYVDIQGFALSTTGAYSVTFECAAPTSAGQFTIPPSMLLAMPTGPSAFASIQVSTYTLPYSLGTVPGIDGALDSSTFETSVPVIFQ